MSHTGIRIRILIPGVGPLLEGDSDFLHMAARIAMADTDQLALDAPFGSGELPWHRAGVILGGPIEIWIQPCELTDIHADDEDLEDDDDDNEIDKKWCSERKLVFDHFSGDYAADWHNCSRPAGHTGTHICHCQTGF